MEPKASRPRRWIFTAAAIGLGLWALAATRAGTPRPAMTWLCNGEPLTSELVEIDQEDRLVLQLDLDEPAYAYVAFYAPSLGTLALFPSQQLRTDLPAKLAAGRHRLPGSADGVDGSWPAMWPARSLCAMVVVSRERAGDIEALFATCRQMGNAAFNDRSMGLYAPKQGGMDAVPPKGTLPTGLLRGAYDLTANGPAGALVPAGDGVWIGTLKASLAEKRGAERDPLRELQQKAALPPK